MAPPLPLRPAALSLLFLYSQQGFLLGRVPSHTCTPAERRAPCSSQGFSEELRPCSLGGGGSQSLHLGPWLNRSKEPGLQIEP